MKHYIKKAISLLCVFAMVASLIQGWPATVKEVQASGNFREFLEEGEFYKDNAQTEGDYFDYDSATNTYTKKGGGYNNYNVAFLFTESKYEKFTLEFDAKFCAPGGVPQPEVKIEFGKQTLGQTTTADKADGATCLRIFTDSNYKYFSYNHMTDGWGTVQDGFDIEATHHIRLLVTGKKYSVVVDDKLLIDKWDLPSNYQNGYIGIGTGAEGAEGMSISNIKIKDGVTMTDAVWMYNGQFEIMETTKTQKDLENCYNYDVLTDTYTRTNDVGWQDYKVAFIYSDKQYENFTMEFDAKFCEPVNQDAWIWLDFGAAYTKDLNEQSIDPRANIADFNIYYAGGALTRLENNRGTTAIVNRNFWCGNMDNEYADSWGNQIDNFDNSVLHHIKLEVKSGVYSLYMDDKTVVDNWYLADTYKGGYVGIGTGNEAAAFSNIIITEIEIADENPTNYTCYYSDNIRYEDSNAKDLTEAAVSKYWTESNGEFIRKKTADEDIQDDLYMSELFFTKKTYKDFELNVKVKLGTNGWSRAFVGFGAQQGKHFQQAGGGKVLYLQGDSSNSYVRYGGWDSAANSYNDGDWGTINYGPLNTDGYTNLRIVVQSSQKQVSVYVGDSDIIQTFLLPSDYNGGYIYFASNSTGAGFSDMKVTEGDIFGTTALGADAPNVEAKAYYSVSEVVSVERKTDKLQLNVKVNGVAMPLYLSFPTLGGLRLYSDNQGVFQPEALETIRYTEEADGALVMSAADGTKVKFYNEGTSFCLKVFNKEDKLLFDLASSQITFGYNDEGLVKVKLAMPLAAEEVIYGTGERFNELNQNGRRTMMWNVDAGYHGYGEDIDLELWRGYKNVPILHSTQGYTLFYNSYYCATVDIGYTVPSVYSMKFCGPEFDVYLWTGEPLDNIESYTDLTGKSVLPEKWSFRYLSGNGSQYWNGGSGAIANLNNVMENYEALGTPDIAAIYLEGVEETDEMFNTCDTYGTRYLRWNSPDMTDAEWSALWPGDDAPRVEDTITGGYSGNFIDFTNSGVGTLMNNWRGSSVDKGLKGGLIDFGELIQPYTLFSNGKTGLEMHNAFSYYYAKGYHDLFESKVGDDYILFARAGSAGMQSYTALFSGDQAANFEGLRQQLVAGLSVSTSGFSVWGGDMAGYNGTPTNEVFCRGLEMSAFYPVMRAHGNTSRMPWDYGEIGKTTYQKYYWLRENLLNTIYSSAVDSSISGLPMMRAFALEYPEQQNLAEIDDSYIFCENMLVAPVLEEGATSRSITFPSGNWYSLWDGSKISGDQTVAVSAPVDTIPVYVRAGAAMPLTLASGLNLAESMQDQEKVQTLLVTPADEARVNDYYIDENTTVQYINSSSNGGYRVTASGANETTAVLAYGTKAKAVLVDGVALKNYASQPETLSGSGYCVDADGNTVVWMENANWSVIDFVAEDTPSNAYKTTWDFNSQSDLTDFNAYINDADFGFAQQDSYSRWNAENGAIVVQAPLYKDGNSDCYWKNMSKSLVALSPKDVSLRNFETEVTFKLGKGAGADGALQIGFREKEAGKSKPVGDSWSFGLQDGDAGVYSGVVTVLEENNVWVHNAGIHTMNQKIDGAQFISNGGYYKLKVRVVESKGLITVTSPDGTAIYQGEFEVYDNLTASGAISYYVNGDCYIDEISLTRLDGAGREQPLKESTSAQLYLNAAENDKDHMSMLLNNAYPYTTIQATITYDDSKISILDFQTLKNYQVLVLNRSKGSVTVRFYHTGNGEMGEFSSFLFEFLGGDDYDYSKVVISDILLIQGDGTVVTLDSMAHYVERNKELLGDSNDNMVVDVSDLVRAKKCVGDSSLGNFKKTDFDHDLCITDFDLSLLRKRLVDIY